MTKSEHLFSKGEFVRYSDSLIDKLPTSKQDKFRDSTGVVVDEKVNSEGQIKVMLDRHQVKMIKVSHLDLL